MAEKISIDIPGIGQVEVTGAASEETLQRIAAALETSSKGLTKDQKDQAKATQLATKAVKDYSTGWVAAADNLTQSFKNLALTATSVAAKFISNYETIAGNPIKASQELLNTAIDLTADFAGGLAGSVPVIGGFLKGVVDAGAALAKLANNMFADQLQKNVAALQIYAKSGISFSGGMQDMQTMATSAGLGLKEFSEVVSKNKIELNKLGLSGGEAAARLAGGLGAATTTIGKSGQNLRRELIKMGFMYEDQGEIFTAFMAQQQAAGKLRTMSDVEVAKGTREYATNLKVISDITGQDAKKLLERANAEMLRGGLQNKLVGDQKIAFTSASGLLTAKSKEAGAALTQYLSLGTIVDPTIAGNKAMADMVRAVGDQVKAGNKDITNYTYQQMASAIDTIKTSGADFAEAVDNSLIAGATGAGANLARVSNEFVQNMGSLTPDPKAAEKSAAANEDQANKANQLGDTTAKLYDATKAQQVLIESKLNPRLETYVGLLEKLNSATIATINKAAGGGDAGLGGPKMTEEEALQNFIKGGGKKGGQYFYNGFLKTYAKGGKIGAGDVGVAGEAGPELISGPANVLSNASYEKLMIALDAMKEKKGVRFGQNGFEWSVDMQDGGRNAKGQLPYPNGGTVNRLATLKNRTSGFDQVSPGQLMEEMAKRPEYADMKRARDAMDDDMGMGKNQVEAAKDTSAKMDQTNALLSELVGHMKQNVTQTSRVAMNTN
jgi:hypothetical protein